MLKPSPSIWALTLTAGLLTACRDDPSHLHALPGSEIKVEVSEGIAGVAYSIVLDGKTGWLVGESCSSGCDFAAGSILNVLTAEEMEHVFDLFRSAGITELDQTDFGRQCCDQFHFRIDYADGETSSTVRGSSELLPDTLQEAVSSLLGFMDAINPLVVALDGTPESWPRDPLEIRSPAIVDDLLSVGVSYGGGCRSHLIRGVAYSGWMESDPVQVRVLLSHEDFNDPCDAWITTDLRFDLTPLKRAYQEAYGTDSEPTTLRILLEDPRLASPLGAWVLEYEF